LLKDLSKIGLKKKNSYKEEVVPQEIAVNIKSANGWWLLLA
jgi:hypothetical protein